VAWAPECLTAHQLVAGHEDGSLRTWDVRGGACVRAVRRKGPEVSALALIDRCVSDCVYVYSRVLPTSSQKLPGSCALLRRMSDSGEASLLTDACSAPQSIVRAIICRICSAGFFICVQAVPSAVPVTHPHHAGSLVWPCLVM
jgi:hypothetical protein